MPAPAGNQNAAKAKVWTAAIYRAIAKRSGEKKDKLAALDDLAESLLAQCDEGDVGALKELGDRLEGKVPQGIVGADGGPVQVQDVPWLRGRSV